MSFKIGQIVETTRKVKFGEKSHIPRGTRGKVVGSQGFVARKYSVEFVHGTYGKVAVTAVEGNFRGTYSF